MQIKKRVGFVLFGTLSLLTLIPSVFALFEGLYFGYYTFPDFINFYYRFGTWFDLAIFTLIFATASRVVFLTIFARKGEDKKEVEARIKGLYIGFGLFGSVGLVLYGNSVGLYGGQGSLLIAFAPFWIILLVIPVSNLEISPENCSFSFL